MYFLLLGTKCHSCLTIWCNPHLQLLFSKVHSSQRPGQSQWRRGQWAETPPGNGSRHLASSQDQLDTEPGSRHPWVLPPHNHQRREWHKHWIWILRKCYLFCPTRATIRFEPVGIVRQILSRNDNTAGPPVGAWLWTFLAIQARRDCLGSIGEEGNVDQFIVPVAVQQEEEIHPLRGKFHLQVFILFIQEEGFHHLQCLFFFPHLFGLGTVILCGYMY